MVQYRPQKRARVQEQQSIATLGKPGCPVDFEGPFRSNIRSFLHDFARGPASTAPALSITGVRAWTLPLRSDRDGAFSLYILEENPRQSHSLYCDRCRVLGWALHPVCQRRYHFIIGSAELEESAGVGKGRKLCLGCNRVVPASTKTCPGCGADATKSKVLEARSHLLHGVIHANGYGHLLRVNGREGGSQSLSGREIMDLWDRLCTMLRARKVSVMDVSKKHNLEFRLLHAVAHGYCWYGRWGYVFGRGSFSISEELYNQAVEAISSIPLKTVVSRSDRKLSSILGMYQSLSKSPLTNVRDLVRLMMEVLLKLRRKALADRAGGMMERPPEAAVLASDLGGVSRWPAKRLEQAQEALVKVLRSAGKSMWLCRQVLREDARSHIGDTGLLDFVLKGFVDKFVDREIVRRRVNARTRTLEYRLEDLDGRGHSRDPPASSKGGDHSTVVGKQPRYEKVVDDLAFLYHRVLESYNPKASQTVLDVRQFIKDYQGEFTRDKRELEPRRKAAGYREEPLRVLCAVESEAKDGGGKSIPPELVVLSRQSTIGALKQNVAKAFRDVYFIFDKFEVVGIPELDGAGDKQKLSSFFSNLQFSLAIKGSGIDERSPARHERGPDEWVVDCECGTEDDDGERMADCDVCGIWQHSRCIGIEDGDPVPQHFVCKSCTLSGCRTTGSAGG